MDDSEKVDSIDERSTVAAKQFGRYFLLALIALVLVVVCLGAGLFGLKNVVEQVTAMTDDQPLSRFEVFNKAIDEVEKNVAEQYAEHTQKWKQTISPR